MNILEVIDSAVQYLSEGVGKVFSPTNDHYPNTGVQPFEGEPFSKWVELRNVKDK